MLSIFNKESGISIAIYTVEEYATPDKYEMILMEQFECEKSYTIEYIEHIFNAIQFTDLIYTCNFFHCLHSQT